MILAVDEVVTYFKPSQHEETFLTFRCRLILHFVDDYVFMSPRKVRMGYGQACEIFFY